MDMNASNQTFLRLGLLSTVVLGTWAAGCDSEPPPDEPFALLVDAVSDLELDARAPAVVPVPAPAPLPVAVPAPSPRCAVDGDGDGVLSLLDYETAVPMAPDACAGAGGAVLGNIAGVRSASLGDGASGSPSALGIEAPPVAAGGNLSVPSITNIPQEVLDWVAGTGIPDRDYVPDSYDCDDFADDLEKAFEELLPGAGTFTYIACDFDAETGNYTSAHAITDVHGGGAVAWIEPQTGQPVDLDKNGDGNVTFALDFSGYPEPTDGGCFIAVFESAEAAQDAGLQLD